MSNLLLQRLEKLVVLTDEDRRALLSRFQRVHRVGPREDLIQDGQDPQYVNLILEGWAYRYKQLKDGRRQIVSFFVPGDMCDPMVFMFREMSHALGSLTPVTVARLTGEEMEALTAQSPALAKAFRLDMLVSAEIQREWTVSLGCRSATERMAHLFCEMMLRLATVGLSDGRECEIPMTQADLADALGLSTVHINRTLQELRGAGLIEFKGRKLTIHDEQALRDLALFDPSYLHLTNSSPP